MTANTRPEPTKSPWQVDKPAPPYVPKPDTSGPIWRVSVGAHEQEVHMKSDIPDWLIIEFPPDAYARTKVRWWKPSYWRAVWDALTNPRYRRYEYLGISKGPIGHYGQMLADILNDNKVERPADNPYLGEPG